MRLAARGSGPGRSAWGCPALPAASNYGMYLSSNSNLQLAGCYKFGHFYQTSFV